MEEMRSLSLDDMEKVSGGSQKKVVTGSATVRSGAGANYSVNGTLGYNTIVNFTGTVSFNDAECRSWYQINSPISGWVLGREIGIDA